MCNDEMKWEQKVENMKKLVKKYIYESDFEGISEEERERRIRNTAVFLINRYCTTLDDVYDNRALTMAHTFTKPWRNEIVERMYNDCVQSRREKKKLEKRLEMISGKIQKWTNDQKIVMDELEAVTKKLES